jgi:hypothetical protein
VFYFYRRVHGCLYVGDLFLAIRGKGNQAKMVCDIVKDWGMVMNLGKAEGTLYATGDLIVKETLTRKRQKKEQTQGCANSGAGRISTFFLWERCERNPQNEKKENTVGYVYER